MAKKTSNMCNLQCPIWLGWVTLIVGVLLVLQDLDIVPLNGLSWGPVALVLVALWGLTAQRRM